MKIFKLLSIAIVLCISGNLYATEYEFIAGDDSLLTKLCMATVTNDKPQLKQYIRSFGGSKNKVNRTVLCNDEKIASFAKHYGALETFAFLDGRAARKYRSQLKATVKIREVTALNSEDDVVIIKVAGR